MLLILLASFSIRALILWVSGCLRESGGNDTLTCPSSPSRGLKIMMLSEIPVRVLIDKRILGETGTGWQVHESIVPKYHGLLLGAILLLYGHLMDRNA